MIMVATDDYTDSFDDLADKLGTPSSTLRRYFKLFKLFIPNKTVKRATKFDKEALQVFEIINNMYAQRMSTAEILHEIAATRKPTLDVRPSPPAPPARQQKDLESLAPALAALLPLAERFLVAYEAQTKALQDIAARMPAPGAIGGHQNAREGQGRVKGHPERETGQDKPVENVAVVDRGAVIARVIALHGQGLGQHAITTRLRREGLRMSARGQLSKSTVARILKGEIST